VVGVCGVDNSLEGFFMVVEGGLIYGLYFLGNGLYIVSMYLEYVFVL